MNILLIGYRGYLGSGLLAYLQSRKHQVVGWDKEEDMFNLTPEILTKEKIDVVLNFTVAADRKASVFMVDSATDRVNVEGARHLARVLKGLDIAWFQISTREVFRTAYGLKDVLKTAKGYRPKYLIDENFPISPQNCYGKSKLIAELISESHPKSNVLRLSTCYTDFDHPLAGNWVLHMIKSAAQGKPVTLAGGGKQFRDPLHIDDLGRLIELMMAKGIYGEKINAGGGRENLISLREFILRAVPNADLHSAPGGDLGFAFDIRKAHKLTGWTPKILFRERIPIIANQVKNNLNNPNPTYGPHL